MVEHRRAPLIAMAALALVAWAGAPASGATSNSLDCEPRAADAAHFDVAMALPAVAQGAPATSQGEVDSLVARAEAALDEGRTSAALVAAERAVRLAAEGGEEAAVARTEGVLGVTLRALGNLEDARQAFERSLEAAGSAGLPAVEAATLNNLANLAAAEPDAVATDEALRLYERATTRALAADDPHLAGRSSLNAARYMARTGAPDDALARLREALDLLERAPAADAVRARELLAAGLVARSIDQRSGRPEARLLAHDLFTRAAALAGESDEVPTRSYALGHLGGLYLAEGRDEEAMALTRQALFLAQTAEAPEILYRWQWQAGRILARQDRLEPAITAYQGAVRSLQSIRRDLPAFDPETGRSLFREQVGPVFLELADLLLQRAGEGGGSVEGDLREARDTVELLKSAELEDYFQDDCVALLQARARTIEEVDDRSAALYPIILPDRLELLLSTGGDLLRETVAVPGDRLEDTARSLRDALVGFGDTRPDGQALYRWLVEPFADALAERQVDTLIFVPDGALRLIPLAVLHDGDGYLLERFAIGTAPGLSLLDPQPLAGRELRPLLSGLTEEVQGFIALPSVEQEIAAIEEMFGGTVLLNDSFSEERLEAELDAVPYNVVHIASHAQFASDPEESFLLTYEDRLTIDELEALIKLSRFRDEPIELIALSACETAAGDDRAALGLAGIAVKAGARSALATLWLVDDIAAATVSASFYRNLGLEQESKAKALRQAQLELLDDPVRSHPFFWAPFLLIGNWL